MVWPCFHNLIWLHLACSRHLSHTTVQCCCIFKPQEGFPTSGPTKHIKCLHGVREEWPRLMCSGPCSLFTCLFSIVLQAACLQERAVTRIHNTDPTACDWQRYSASGPKERQPRSLEPRKSHEILEAITTISVLLPPVAWYLRSLLAVTSEWRKPLWRGNVNLSQRALCLFSPEPVKFSCFWDQQWQESAVSLSPPSFLYPWAGAASCLHWDGWWWLNPHMGIRATHPTGETYMQTH